MKDAVAGRCVERLLETLPPRELAADLRLAVVDRFAGEDEMVVRDGGLARIDRVAAGDLLERVDRERRRAVGGRQQIRQHPQRRSRRDLRVLVHAVRPDDLLGRRQPARCLRVRPDDLGTPRDGLAKLPASDGEDASAPPDLLLLRRQRDGLVVLALRLVAQPPRRGVEGERVAVARVGDGLGALEDVKAEVAARCGGRCRPSPFPQTTTSSSPASSATPFKPAGLISREEPMAKRSPAMRNVSPECTRLRKSGTRWRKDPAFQRSSSVARLSETQSAEGVIWSVSMASSLLARALRIPQDERAAPDRPRGGGRTGSGRARRAEGLGCDAGLPAGPTGFEASSSPSNVFETPGVPPPGTRAS